MLNWLWGIGSFEFVNCKIMHSTITCVKIKLIRIGIRTFLSFVFIYTVVKENYFPFFSTVMKEENVFFFHFPLTLLVKEELLMSESNVIG